MRWIRYWVALVRWYHRNDPLKQCPDPCAHIDGPLCSVRYCGMRGLWETDRPEPPGSSSDED